MNKLLLISCLLLSTFHGIGQSAEELNKKSKELLQKQDLKGAVSLMRKAAEQGNAEAQYNYGICYQQGIQVPQNDSVANTWFLKAAMQGDVNAQFKIAYSYAIGRGVPQDSQKAFQWSLKCAEQQDVECMFNVVSCYMEGRGAKKNVDSMLAWATRLALLETPENLQVSGQITSARANLASMYQDGKYVSKNLQSAYMWYLIYNESKRDLSILVQQENIKAIQALEKQLSLIERDTARKEAEKNLGRKLNNMANLYKQDL